MADTNGVKISLPEYTARKVLDVTARALPPLLIMTGGYILYFHGEEIANSIKNRKARKLRKK